MDYFKNGKELYFAKLSQNAIIPTKNDEDAGFDIYACTDEDMTFVPLETKLVPTQIACAMSPNYYLQIFERSSTGSKGIKRSAGVVDSGYRGEIKVAITNCTNKTLVLSNKTAEELSSSLGIDTNNLLVYPKTKAIAEFVILPVPKMEVAELDYAELCKIPSKRSTGGFGSSGK